MRKTYVWKRADVAKKLHRDMADMQRQKDAWWQKYIEAETQDEENEAQQHIDEINGFLASHRRIIALMEAEVKL